MILIGSLLWKLVGIYGIWCASERICRWAWAKTHPGFRYFTFTSYTGHYWRLNGSRNWLVASPLTDQLQNLHDETGGRSEPRLSLEEP